MPRIPYKKIVELARRHMTVYEFAGFAADLDKYVDEQPLLPAIADMTHAEAIEELQHLRQINAQQSAIIAVKIAENRRQAATIVDLQHKLNTKGTL